MISSPKSFPILNYIIFKIVRSIYNSIDLEGVGDFMSDTTLKIKRRGEDGYKLISVRIKEETLEALDKLATETNYSRNELINVLLQHSVEHVEVE